jgi:hypothetical protein
MREVVADSTAIESYFPVRKSLFSRMPLSTNGLEGGIEGMSLRFVAAVLGLVLIVAGSVFYTVSGKQSGTVQPVPQVVLSPEPAPPDNEITEKILGRFIAEDPGIQAALQAAPPASASFESVASHEEPQSEKDILFELMAPYVYINYRTVNHVEQAQFVNNQNRKTTDWIPVGGTLQGATLVSMDSDKALVKLGSTTQELLLVPLNPPPFDPSVPRTPEQVADAQRRYKEFYYKNFVVMGKRYNELAGRPRDFKIPPKEERLKQVNDYFDMMEKRMEETQPLNVPQEALLDPEQLDGKEREVYETYLQTLNRTPEEVREAIREFRAKVVDQLKGEGQQAAPGQDGSQ